MTLKKSPDFLRAGRPELALRVFGSVTLLAGAAEAIATPVREPAWLAPLLAVDAPGTAVVHGGWRYSDAGRVYSAQLSDGRSLSLTSIGGVLTGSIEGGRSADLSVLATAGKAVTIPFRPQPLIDDVVRTPRSSTAVPTRSKAGAPEANLDILVVYDPVIDSVDGMFYALTQAALTQDYLDETFANSGISTRPRLVGLEPLDPKTRDLQTAISRITDVSTSPSQPSNDGEVAAIRQRLSELRTQYQPDVVILLMKRDQLNGGLSGLANIYEGNTTDADKRATAVVIAGFDEPTGGTAQVPQVFAHELGHLLGSAHVRSEPNSWRSYGYGKKCGAKADLMASGYVTGINGTLRLYSTPTVSNDGEPCGIAPGQPEEADAATSAKDALVFVTAHAQEITRTGSFSVDPLPAWTMEPASGTTTLPVTIRRSGDASSAGSVQVVFYTEDDPRFFKGDVAATQFGDQNQRVSFAAGETVTTVNLQVSPDNGQHRNDRFLRAQLLFPIGVNLGQPITAETAYLDRDHEQQAVGFDRTSIEIAEGQSAVVNLRRPGNPSCSGSCYYGLMGYRLTTANGSAVAGTDYTAVNTEGVVASGRDDNGFAVDQVLPVSIAIPDNATKQGPRSFTYQLEAPLVAAGAGTLTVTIVDNEDTGLAQFASATSGAAEGTTASITVTRSRSSRGALQVGFEIRAGSAVAGADFTPTSGNLRFADGETSKTIEIPLPNDGASDGAKTISVVLTGAAADLGPVTSHTLTAIDGPSSSAGGGGSANLLWVLIMLAATHFRWAIKKGRVMVVTGARP